MPGVRRPYAARVPLEVRREQLLDAALAVLVREGYEGVSVDAIAREAGVTRPVVYGAYDGLGPLLGSLLDRQQARAFGQLAVALPAPGSGPADLVAALGVLIETVLADPVTWKPILLAPVGTPEVVRARIDADRERLLRQVSELVAPWGAPDPELTAQAVVALLEHFGRLLLAEPERFGRDRLVAFAGAMVGSLAQGSTP